MFRHTIRNCRLSNAVQSVCERLEGRQMFNVTGATFADEVTYGTDGESALCVAVGDLNNDGKTDIVAGTSGQGDVNNVRVYLGSGDGTFAAGVAYATDGQPSKLRVADLNGDGLNDVLLLNETFNTSSSTNVRVYLNAGNGTLAAPTEVASDRYGRPGDRRRQRRQPARHRRGRLVRQVVHRHDQQGRRHVQRPHHRRGHRGAERGHRR